MLAGIGADAGDDPDLRQKKALLVVLAVLILPVSVVWGILYLSLGSAVGDPVRLLRRLAPLVAGVRPESALHLAPRRGTLGRGDRWVFRGPFRHQNTHRS